MVAIERSCSLPKGIPLTEEEQARRRREIFDAAVRLFVSQGFNETSMREIASAAGVGKSTLYDYFRTKDDVLLFVLEEEFEKLLNAAQAIAVEAIPAPDRLTRMMHLHFFGFLLANKGILLQLSTQASRLGPAAQERIQARRWEYQDLIRRVIEQGVAEGSLRPLNALLAARALLALLTPAAYTSRPSGSPEQMLEEVLAIFMDGVRA
jgi:AcrR family transcriptional regulator